MTDLHNHLMPGVDDGAADADEARAGLLAMRDAGVQRLATTPHVDASAMQRQSWERRIGALDEAWARLEEIGREAAPEMQLHRGAEVRLDVPDPDLSDPRVHLAGGAAVLVEFAYFTVPPHSGRIIERLRQREWIPVIAHPERYRGIGADLGVVAVWRSAGGLIQVNAGSLTGRYGSEARSNALSLLTAGLIDCLSSDYHARGTPELQAARSWLAAVGAEGQAELLMDVNPARILNGEPPMPVPPLERRPGIMARIWNVMRG